MRHTRQSLASALALVLLPGAAAAVEPLDTVSFSVGSYVSRFDTRIRADGQILDGTTVDLSRDLGLDPEDLLAFARLTWRPFDRHEFGLSYYGDSVSADHRLQRDISFEDDLYQADATVHADMSLKSLEAYYSWW